ncbi:hypothetical protein DZA65_03211 [Dickeya dianthicola]|uniref:hypothetical protein n=1 Tax=Dickeya dianthicola TaxID=204039 RepID=UPI000EB64F0D|nr:hypothetical protein [Dickeya dianthicola]AYC20086.1 hypothetical protein DZA65_03211 [Dickeya dianthicola]QVH40519.1 hypothetical protein JRZ93_16155 [Dickeya dianthicola]QVH44719.1 hypothetical protein JRZ83_16165 [Dickeya dianthicola]QVH48920.1 hypothetical protein JRZ88_16170 [Dickeya dianthicola]QVH53120.1 hypothetical protein JRZ86_16165 [Dickeya dianthicola]
MSQSATIIIPTDIGAKISEIEAAYQHYLTEFRIPGVDDVVEWAKTGRGGKVFDLVKASLDTSVCSSRYGLCE